MISLLLHSLPFSTWLLISWILIATVNRFAEGRVTTHGTTVPGVAFCLLTGITSADATPPLVQKRVKIGKGYTSQQGTAIFKKHNLPSVGEQNETEEATK